MAHLAGDDFHKDGSFSKGVAPSPATGQDSEADPLGGMQGSAPDAAGADPARQALRNGPGTLGSTGSGPGTFLATSIGQGSRQRQSGVPTAGILPTDGDDTAAVAAGENLPTGKGEDPTRASSGQFGEPAGQSGDPRPDGGLFSKS